MSFARTRIALIRPFVRPDRPVCGHKLDDFDVRAESTSATQADQTELPAAGPDRRKSGTAPKA
eukprot:COSAG06_NODE_13252_length_1278_cov_1.010178_1_plen_63_part_00